MVKLYKREIRLQQPTLDLHYKLENMELFDIKSILYFRKELNSLRNPTLFFETIHTIQIKKLGIINSSFFYGKSIIVSCYIYPSKKNIIRKKEHFRWLFKMLNREFPQTLIPSLLKS